MIKKDDRLVLYTSLFFLLIFLIWYPTNILNNDEWQYFRQGLGYSQGMPTFLEINPVTGLLEVLEPGRYPIGSPFFLAGLIFLFGKKAIFLQGLISILISIFFISRTLRHLNLNPRFVLLIFLFFPCVLLSRTIMSDIPSLAVISIFIYLVTLVNQTKYHYLLIGFVGGFSILFREPNLILVLPFLFSIIYKKEWSIKLLISLGLIIAISIRLIGTYWAFGDPFYLKDTGVLFSVFFFLKNLIFYLPFLLIFIPFGIWAVVKYNGKWNKEIKFTLATFISLYLIYGYNGSGYSGAKSIFVGSRFLIPALPLFIICVADFLEKKHPRLIVFLFPISILSIFSFNFLGHYYNNIQNEIYQGLEKKNNKVHLITDLRTLPKIFTPNGFDLPKIYLHDTILVEEILKKDTFMYVEMSFRKDNETAKKISESEYNSILNWMSKYKTTEIYKKSLPDNIIIKQFKLSNF